MKEFVLFACALVVTAAIAGDFEIVKDACNAQRISAKKSECLAALDRLTVPPPPAPKVESVTEKLKFSPRAYNCEPFEFAELDSMKQSDIESAICSMQAGLDSDKAITDAAIAGTDNPAVKIGLINRRLAKMQRCSSQMSKMTDLFQRKFDAKSYDCTKLKKAKPATDESQVDEAKSNSAP